MKKYNMDTKRRAAAGLLGMMMILAGRVRWRQMAARRFQ